MPHVITQACCNDATCSVVCPVNCIHPTPDEPEYQTSEMLYIDPDRCIDCGACIEVCPVDAIVRSDDLVPDNRVYLQLNASYYADRPSTWAAEPVDDGSAEPAGHGGVHVRSALRVAIVGTGPSACYAAEELLGVSGLNVEVTMFDRLPVPGGLLRYGVAPDHFGTRRLGRWFDRTLSRDGLSLHLNVEIGRDITDADLLAHHHAVIYGVGAGEDRSLGIAGEHLPGSYGAGEFVAWYNGHPDAVERSFDLSGDRAVVIGNGNVALDVARILLKTPEDLAHTDIADHALKALSRSKISEVVVLGRRGPEHLAATTPELLALAGLPGTDVTVSGADGLAGGGADGRDMSTLKLDVLAGYAATRIPGSRRRIDLRFLRSPVEVLGADRVTGLRTVVNVVESRADGRSRVVSTGEHDDIACGAVFRAIGYRGRPVPDLPFDQGAGVIPNEDGRVLDRPGGHRPSGHYVVGWIKRGPSGVLGTNRQCAASTVDALLADWRDGRLLDPQAGRREFDELIRQRCPEAVDRAGWRRIDRAERWAGQEADRPRRKLVTVEEMLAQARTGAS